MIPENILQIRALNLYFIDKMEGIHQFSVILLS